jgi:hypothetical protein
MLAVSGTTCGTPLPICAGGCHCDTSGGCIASQPLCVCP